MWMRLVCEGVTRMSKKKTDDDAEAVTEEVAPPNAPNTEQLLGFQQVEGHGWSDEELAARAWPIDQAETPAAAAPNVSMTSDTVSSTS